MSLSASEYVNFSGCLVQLVWIVSLKQFDIRTEIQIQTHLLDTIQWTTNAVKDTFRIPGYVGF